MKLKYRAGELTTFIGTPEIKLPKRFKIVWCCFFWMLVSQKQSGPGTRKKTCELWCQPIRKLYLFITLFLKLYHFAGYFRKKSYNIIPNYKFSRINWNKYDSILQRKKSMKTNHQWNNTKVLDFWGENPKNENSFKKTFKMKKK